MYEFLYAYARSDDARHWERLEAIEEQSVTQLVAQYPQLWLVLTHTHRPKAVSITALEILHRMPNPQASLKEYFEALGEVVLPTQDQIPHLHRGRLGYEDAYRAGYRVDVVDRYSSQTNTQYELNHWITLERWGLDTERFYKHALVSVNGYLHPTDYDTNRIYVQEAVRTTIVSTRAEIGIYSFLSLGELSFIPITEDMVVDTQGEIALKDRTVLKVDRDLSEVIPAISLGGYLHILEPKVLRVVGEGLLQLDWASIPLVERYYESRTSLDLSSLELLETSTNADAINIHDIYSDRALKAYLTLPQSFVILLHANDVNRAHRAIEQGPVWDRYFDYCEHRDPMLSPTGRLLEYWKFTEHGVNSYFTPRASKLNYSFRTTALGEHNNIDDELIGAFPATPEARGTAHFLELSRSELRFA